MPKLFDRVKVNIATTGTGTVTFGAASSNAFLTPTEAGCADADTVRYVIVDGTDYEEGIGTIASSVATMARTTVTKSKIAGTAGTTKLDLSGTAVLAFVASAADIVNAANNLSDLADAPTALTNLGGTTTGKLLFGATNAADARNTLGATVTGEALFTAVDALVARSAIGVKFGQYVLAKNGSNVVLSPKRGNLLTISGVSYPVPTAGVSLAPTGLTVGTLYYIYAYMNSGTMTLEASTTSHSTSTTTGNEGVEIKTGDDTRTLVGMVRPITGPAFADTAAQRFVRSWFNEKGISTQAAFDVAPTTTSSTPVEIRSTIRNEFLIWADEIADFSEAGSVYNSSATQSTYSSIAFDGTVEAPQGGGGSSTANQDIATGERVVKSGLSEGYHYATVFGKVTGGTGTWYGTANHTLSGSLYRAGR